VTVPGSSPPSQRYALSSLADPTQKLPSLHSVEHCQHSAAADLLAVPAAAAAAAGPAGLIHCLVQLLLLLKLQAAAAEHLLGRSSTQMDRSYCQRWQPTAVA
jgi:hypothetical protein